MKHVTAIFVVLALIFPPLAHAQVYSSVSASSDTGGNNATNGRNITTGDSSASVEVHTIVGGTSGSSSVHIETSVNGKKHEETFTKPLGNIHVSVVATSSGYKISTSTSTSTSATTTKQKTVAPSLHPIENISNWFGKFFNFLKIF